MQDYYEHHAESLRHFKNEARKAFASICKMYGLREELGPLDDSVNLFQTTFSNSAVRITVEGINWGMNARLSLGITGRYKSDYDIYQILQERIPAVVITGGQIEQIYSYACYLEEYLSDVLSGNSSLFETLDEKSRRRQEKIQQELKTEAERKRLTGYTQIESPFGDIIWRKHRPYLTDIQTAKKNFPKAIEVFLSHCGVILPDNAEAVIISWQTDVDDTMIKDAILCEVTTEKVSVEIHAPHSGKLVWLLEEGTFIKSNDCIALIVQSNE